MTPIVEESIVYHFGKIPPTMVMTWLVWAVLFIVSLMIAKTLKYVPGRAQSALEFFFAYIFGLADDIIGPKAGRYYPLFLGLFIFILVSNLLGLVPGLISPTSDPNVTFGLAIAVFVYYNFEGFKHNGIKYLAHFSGPPMPAYLFPVKILLFVIEVISNFCRPLSLGLRLFCNVFSKEILLGLLSILAIKFIMMPGLINKGIAIMPFVLRPVVLILGAMLGLIQALVFLVLSISYIGGAVRLEEE